MKKKYNIKVDVLLGSVSFLLTVSIAMLMGHLFDVADEAIRRAPVDLWEIVIDFLGIVFLSPLLESAVLLWLFNWISRRFNSTVSIIVSAGVVASLHSFLYPLWGVISYLSLLISCLPFISSDSSSREKIIHSGTIHSVHNFFAFIVFIAIE